MTWNSLLFVLSDSDFQTNSAKRWRLGSTSCTALFKDDLKMRSRIQFGVFLLKEFKQNLLKVGRLDRKRPSPRFGPLAGRMESGHKFESDQRMVCLWLPLHPPLVSFIPPWRSAQRPAPPDGSYLRHVPWHKWRTGDFPRSQRDWTRCSRGGGPERIKWLSGRCVVQGVDPAGTRRIPASRQALCCRG